MNVLFCFWGFGSFLLVLVALLFFSQTVTNIGLKFLLVYGKQETERCHSFYEYFQVPKRWFTHFYIIGVVVNSYAVYMVWNTYMQGENPPYCTEKLLYILYLTSSGSGPTIDASTAFILLTLMLVQNLRRLYECVYVSIFSDGKMNIAHYVAGIVMYSTYHLAILSESPDINKIRVYKFDIAWWQTVGLALFFWASWQQFQILCYLSLLRKNNKSGNMVSYRYQHYMPSGGWFNLVSSPHYMMEILIYTSFLLLTGFRHWTLWSILAFVLCNQLISGYSAHMWYKQHFVSYPKERFAVIPYIF